MNSTLSAAAAAMQGVLHGADRVFDGVSTDTRTMSRGQLFFALAGPNFDGQKFLAEAADKGAAGAVVSACSKGSLAHITDDQMRAARACQHLVSIPIRRNPVLEGL